MPWHSLLFASLALALAWLWQARSRNAGIVDAVWALAIAGLAVCHGVTGSGSAELRWLAALVMGGWYLRLGAHLWRRLLSEPEDGRYQRLRARWGDRANRNHFWLFQLQAVLAWLFSLPAWVIGNGDIDSPGLCHYLGVAVAAVAFAGVTVADRQLRVFRSRADNRGEVCQRGLWHYSRHPNYFFEWLHWFAYPLLAWGVANGAWLWLAPLAMLVFLLYLTGIPYAEQQAIRTRGQKYIDYQRTTSAFIPWRKSHETDCPG